MNTLEVSGLLEDPLNAVPRAIDELRRGGHQIRELSLSERDEGVQHFFVVAILRDEASAQALSAKLRSILHLTGNAQTITLNTTPEEELECTKLVTS